MKTKHWGFTSAEVLITLGIIGVVAAMTIPTLVANYQKNQKMQYVTALKRSYTTMSEAVKQLMTDKGCTVDMLCTDLFSASATSLTFGDEIVKYFKVAKNCKNAGGCVHTAAVFWDGTGGSYGHLSYSFITVDGMAYEVGASTNSCTSSAYDTTKKACTDYRVDLNGNKKPNATGRDYFFFKILSDGTVWPQYGVSSTIAYNLCTYHRLNEACAGRIIYEGWQMNY